MASNAATIMNVLHGKLQDVNKIHEQHGHDLQIQFTFSNN